MKKVIAILIILISTSALAEIPEFEYLSLGEKCGKVLEQKNYTKTDRYFSESMLPYDPTFPHARGQVWIKDNKAVLCGDPDPDLGRKLDWIYRLDRTYIVTGVRMRYDETSVWLTDKSELFDWIELEDKRQKEWEYKIKAKQNAAKNKL